MKIVSLETRALSAEKENDSLKLALRLIMQEKSVSVKECQHQQSTQSYEVTTAQGNSKSDNAQSNESSNQNEWQTVGAKKKKRKIRRKKMNEAQSNANGDMENSTPVNESTTDWRLHDKEYPRYTFRKCRWSSCGG